MDGQVYAMAGSSHNHVRLADSILGILPSHLKGKTCQSFSSDLKVKKEQVKYISG